jgi:CHASE2 domain-containing sensor protein
MGFTVTAIVIAVLAGIGTFYTWDRNKGLSMGLAVITLLAGAAGTVGAFVAALSFFFRILPILLMVGGIWLIWKVIQKNRGRDRTDVQY